VDPASYEMPVADQVTLRLNRQHGGDRNCGRKIIYAIETTISLSGIGGHELRNGLRDSLLLVRRQSRVHGQR